MRAQMKAHALALGHRNAGVIEKEAVPLAGASGTLSPTWRLRGKKGVFTSLLCIKIFCLA
jgi:hypothetical protein